MPELPEVETIRRGLARHLVGRRIGYAEVFHPRAVRRHSGGAADFTGRLIGRRIQAVSRRGKYLWFALDSDLALLAHLGMSGQFLLADAASPSPKHLRARFAFTDGDPELRFVDQRTFGGLTLAPLIADVPASISHIAPDILDVAFDEAEFHRRFTQRRTGVKRALLDQTLISGVGNIYADEALWRARLHYATPTVDISAATCRRLLAALRAVFRAALRAGGTSFDALYVNVNGQSGFFDRSLAVYGRAGQPCRRCGTAIVREPFMNRSSFRCPACQPVPRRPHW